MAIIQRFMGAQVSITPKPQINSKATLSFSPNPLKQFGFVLPVSISFPPTRKESSQEQSTVLVAALLDTGASSTNIDRHLAEYLKLSLLE